MGLPMLVIVSKFVANHCGDHVKDEEQFTVTSSEVGGSMQDDDFDILDVAPFDVVPTASASQYFGSPKSPGILVNDNPSFDNTETDCSLIELQQNRTIAGKVHMMN